MSLGRAGFIGRFKPLHVGGARVLEEICKNTDHLIIGVGSSNKYDLRNPFTAEESQKMIDVFLSPKFSNYSFIHIPDFGHIPQFQDGQKWKEYVKSKFKDLDYFVAGNSYVKSLLAQDYKVIDAHTLLHDDQKIRLSATQVRIAMARGRDWRNLVPESTAQYIAEHKLDDRFRREFGLATIALAAGYDLATADSFDAEKKYVMSGK